jgi:hypothetical protein|tara:strand:- start:36 stop:206 length:171 start_codon:yes stop_codon:yes gene_type:complete
MSITYKFFKNTADGENVSVEKSIDGVCVLAIPLDINNIDYQEYLEWAKTNTTQPAD